MGLQGYLPGFPSSYVCPAHFDMMSRDLCYLEGGTTKADQIAGSDWQKGNKRVWRVEWLVLLYSPPPPNDGNERRKPRWKGWERLAPSWGGQRVHCLWMDTEQTRTLRKIKHCLVWDT